MKKGFVLLFSLLVFSLIIGGTMRHSANSFAQNPLDELPPEDGGPEMQFDSIDEKALQAKDNDESAIRALVDEVFSVTEFAIIPTADREAMKERVLYAELDYRIGRSEGISEENIVLTVNELADKFAAPDFTRTSALQVRVLRARLMNGYPNFIAQDTTSGETGTIPGGGGEPTWNVALGDSVSETMSPLEAVYVTGVLLWQKMLNDDYQYTPQEWVDKVYNKAVEQWQADLSGNPEEEPGEDESRYRIVESGNDGKRKQMITSITTGAATLLPPEGQTSPNLYDATLDTLGIKREGL